MSQALFQILNSNFNLFNKLHWIWICGIQSILSLKETYLPFSQFLFLSLDSLEKSKISNPAASHAYNIFIYVHCLCSCKNSMRSPNTVIWRVFLHVYTLNSKSLKSNFFHFCCCSGTEENWEFLPVSKPQHLFA